MTELRMGKHSIRSETAVVEIWKDGQMIGTIYPAESGVRVVSKYHLVPSDVVSADTLAAVDIRIVRH